MPSLPTLPAPKAIVFDRGGVLVHGTGNSATYTPSEHFAHWMAEHYGIKPNHWIAALQEPNQGYDLGRLTPRRRLLEAADT